MLKGNSPCGSPHREIAKLAQILNLHKSSWGGACLAISHTEKIKQGKFAGLTVRTFLQELEEDSYVDLASHIIKHNGKCTAETTMDAIEEWIYINEKLFTHCKAVVAHLEACSAQAEIAVRARSKSISRRPPLPDPSPSPKYDKIVHTPTESVGRAKFNYRDSTTIDGYTIMNPVQGVVPTTHDYEPIPALYNIPRRIHSTSSSSSCPESAGNATIFNFSPAFTSEKKLSVLNGTDETTIPLKERLTPSEPFYEPAKILPLLAPYPILNTMIGLNPMYQVEFGRYAGKSLHWVVLLAGDERLEQVEKQLESLKIPLNIQLVAGLFGSIPAPTH